MAKRDARRYFWALHFPPGAPERGALSPEALQGLVYATELAEHARERSRSALQHHGGATPAPLTADDLAWRDGLARVEVRRKIKLARTELFGKDIGDSAISHRLKKRRAHRVRTCAELGCGERISALAHAGRRYCSMHAAPAARVRRHRHGAAGPARPPRRYMRGGRTRDRRPPDDSLSEERIQHLIALVLAGKLDQPKRSSKRRRKSKHSLPDEGKEPPSRRRG